MTRIKASPPSLLLDLANGTVHHLKDFLITSPLTASVIMVMEVKERSEREGRAGGIERCLAQDIRAKRFLELIFSGRL